MSEVNTSEQSVGTNNLHDHYYCPQMKVKFLHVSAILFTEGGECGGGVWQGDMCATVGACMAGGVCGEGGIRGKGGACLMKGGCVWQGEACMAGELVYHRGDACHRGHVWWGVHGGGFMWWGGGRACVAEETATAVCGTHPTGMHSCYS